MFLEKFTGERIERFEFGSDYSLNPIEISVNKSQKSSAFRISFSNDENNEKLRLLAILSPIFIASFDNGAYELEYLKDSIANSSYEFGLYPHFFKNFQKSQYFKDDRSEDDIYLSESGLIYFSFNDLDEKYLPSLACLINELIINDDNRKELLAYFKEIRDDIVINGRRSILANGIQAFYLSKYVVVWMLDLISFIKEKNPGAFKYLLPIYELASNLKTPRNLK